MNAILFIIIKFVKTIIFNDKEKLVALKFVEK